MKTERHLPKTWEKLDNIKIYDPDGWREDGKSFNSPLTREEWEHRKMRSTCIGWIKQRPIPSRVTIPEDERSLP